MSILTNPLKFFVITLTLVLLNQTVYAGPRVLFDQAHGQQFLVEENRPLDLSGLANLFIEEGAVVTSSSTPITEDLLRDIDILIISGPFVPLSQNEVLSIMKFLYRGGKAAVMLHIAQPFNELLPHLGVAVSAGAVNEQENIVGANAKDFQVKDIKPHPLTIGLDSFNVYGGWALLNTRNGVEIVSQTSHKAWVDLNQNGELNEKDAVQSFAMILAGTAGKGSFVVFGDDAMFQNQFLKDGNLSLARNLAIWFCGEKKSI